MLSDIKKVTSMKNKSRKSSIVNRGQKNATKIRNKDDWRHELDSIRINDDRWWCMVTMMVETIAEHSRYVSLFDEAVEDGGQACIYSLSYQRAVNTVKTLAKQDPEKCPAVESICHYVDAILSENNDHLSTWLIARLIKYLIYRAKTEHIERLKVEADRGKIDEECPTVQNTDGSTSSRSITELRRAYSNETEYVFNGKVNTRLRTDNVPFDGPKLYVVLSGFRNPDLPAELLSVGVPLTCILEIKLPGEQYIAHREAEEGDTTIRGKTHFFEDRHTNETELLEFWRVTRERFANLSAYPMYSDITVLTVHPSIIPETINAIEKASRKRDIYNRVLLTLHHLYDLCRQHAKYLKSMKLEKGIVDTRNEMADTEIYESALSDIPNEYIGVPLILSAILLQIEHNLATSSDGRFPVDHDTGFSGADTRHENTSTTAERSPVFNMQDKLKLLDLEYELTDEYADGTSQPSELEVVPYGDTLSMIICQRADRLAARLDDAVLRVLRDPRIINVWRDHVVPTRSRSDMYLCHMDNIARAFDRERTVSREEIVHYVHLLMFDDLIFSGGSRAARARLLQSPGNESPELRRARSAIRRARSVPNFTSPLYAASSLRRSKSDTEIDYCKPVVTFTECPLLFALTDARETLLPGYLREHVFTKRSYERPSLEEYEDVELLSCRVFLQVAHDCFQSFDRFAARYFEPTDSVLLYFSDNNSAVDDVSEERCLSSIRTPIGLHEFCEYIAVEKENWMKRERETRQSRRTDLTGRFMKKSIEVEDDDAIIFDDECFMLPDSLKARRLKRSSDRDGQKKIFETKKFEEVAAAAAAVENVKEKKMTEQKRNEAPTANNGSGRADGRVMSGKTSMTEKKSDTKIDDVDTSFLPVKKILSSQCVVTGGPYDFVGYDLGGLRVQVIHHSKKFLLDGDTSVRVELEDWLHGDRDLRIAVTLSHCTLRLSSGVSRRHSTDTFHLTTKRGIVLGFHRNRRELVENSSDSHWRNLTFDFRASWPSGLLIEPTVEDGTKNPFCIRQSYVSKRPGRAGAAREVRRNFLRNGTVLKYLDDNTVVIFRSNGVIVTCMDFDKPQSHDESIHEADPKKFRIKKGNSRQSVAAKHSGKVTDSTETRSNGSIVKPSKQHVLRLGELVTSDGDDSLITGALAVGEVLRYSVVNYDGRRYEVLNDLVVSEHDRLLVRTTSDYEVNEVFTRRADGTDTLLRSNGELVVTFPDGTCIITGYTVEEQPVICEWTKNELKRYFGDAETKEHGALARSSPDIEFTREGTSVPHVGRQGEPTRAVSIADGFVSILLTFRMEHKDYAAVSYDQSAVCCTLSMPDNLRVSISRRGHYKVSMGDQVNLKISDDDTAFWKRCATCGERSTSTYKFRESFGADARTILTTVGILGNVLEVKSDGTTRYRRSEGRRRGRDECNDDNDVVLEHGEERRSGEERDAKSGARIHCKHERYCETLKFPARSQYRIFAMNRDLTACEYLHRSVRCEQEVAAVFDDEMSMIQYPISRRPELHRLITFVPVKPELGSKEMFCQYRVTSDKRTDYDRIELPRSTYSFPYNWLFPFGKKVVPERTRNEVLAKRNEQSLPKLLRVRVFFGIKGADRSVLIDMQRAMGRYWISVLRDGDKCRLFYATGSSRPCEVENDYGSSEDGLRELAVGVKGSIDAETYVRSLRGKLIKVSTKAPRQSSRLAELLRQRGTMKEVYEWYKQCMRKRIIVPYFGNIADSLYFFMKNHVVGVASRKSHLRVSREKEEELIDRNEENC
ncbi:PREDICTED: uncharacterized protein LOC105462379 [Wasmannia auropunctata]|uniref:uncharacterized protein LOC105462379 n=1 Tax=Wasmannia auropunctata TaxID=64793 RepID=UPI0005EDFB43|nr:PREDICTED: uncharacterized protein LOC105462379 [Wasmannia auropunctata]